MCRDFPFVVSIWSEVERKAQGLSNPPSAKRPKLRRTLPTVFEFFECSVASAVTQLILLVYGEEASAWLTI